MAESAGKSHIRKRAATSKSKHKNDGVKIPADDDRDNEKKPTGVSGQSSESIKEKPIEPQKNAGLIMETGSYWLTRIVLTRAIGFIYCTY